MAQVFSYDKRGALLSTLLAFVEDPDGYINLKHSTIKNLNSIYIEYIDNL